jgi:hypothetical protein
MPSFLAFIGRSLAYLVSGGKVALLRKMGFATAYIAVYTALVVALAFGFKGLFANVATTLPAESLLAAGLSLLPPKTSVFISSLSVAYATSQIFIFRARILQIKIWS